MSMEIKYVLQAVSFIILIACFVALAVSGRVNSKVKKLPHEEGLKYEKERAKLDKKQFLSPGVQIVISVLIMIYLVLSLAIPKTVKSWVGGDDAYSTISFIITLIVVLPLGIRSYKNIKAWNSFKKETKIDD